MKFETGDRDLIAEALEAFANSETNVLVDMRCKELASRFRIAEIQSAKISSIEKTKQEEMPKKISLKRKVTKAAN
jgi:hypothetical protein